MIDKSHDPAASSWVPGADEHEDFPVQNLPFGIFSTTGEGHRAGVAIGSFVLDLRAIGPHLTGHADFANSAICSEVTLNALFALPAYARQQLRQRLFELLTDASHRDAILTALVPIADCTMHLPLSVRDYTDFYAGIHHARAVGALLRPENPLLPNYKYVPVGYHGRSSSIRVSGTPIIRPNGQIKQPGSDNPAVGPSRRLDYEVELGFWISGDSELGEPIVIGDAYDRIAGVCLLNDWSARDLQAWEYVPLGPFLAKNFATTVSPWVVTAEALEPFRGAQPPRPAGDPAPLPYLFDKDDQSRGALCVSIEVSLCTHQMRENHNTAHVLGRTMATHLYWTPGQLIAHHTVNGCDLAAGDLLGSGTISGPNDDARGSLMELSRGGRDVVDLPNGESRTFLENGDEVRITGRANRSGYRSIGFGECVGVICGPRRRGQIG